MKVSYAGTVFSLVHPANEINRANEAVELLKRAFPGCSVALDEREQGPIDLVDIENDPMPNAEGEGEALPISLEEARQVLRDAGLCQDSPEEAGGDFR